MAKKTDTRRQFGAIRKLPSGRYQAHYTGPDGAKHKAPHTFDAKIDAEAWLIDRKRELDRDPAGWSPQAGHPKAAAPTFRAFAAQWLADRQVKGRPIRPRTREHYQKLLDQHILPTFGDRTLDLITDEAVAAWYRKLLPDAPTMRAHTYSLFRTIMGDAVPKWVAANPVQIRGAGSVERASKTTLPTAEQLAIITAEMPEAYRAMVPLAAWAGLRWGEITELRRSDIDAKAGVIRVRRGVVRTEAGHEVGDPKSAAGARDVALPPHVLPALKAHLRDHVSRSPNALLFSAKGDPKKHLAVGSFNRWWAAARKKAGREDLRFHDLRHHGATLAAQAGSTLAELMARIGHSTPQAALRYQNVAAGRDAEIAARMSALGAR